MNYDNKAFKYLNAVTQMLITIFLSAMGGLYLDKYLKTTPVFILILTIAGFVCGFILLYKKVMQIDKQ